DSVGCNGTQSRPHADDGGGLYPGDLFGADATDQAWTVSVSGDQSKCGCRSAPDCGLYRYDLGRAQGKRGGGACSTSPGDGESLEGQYPIGLSERPVEPVGTPRRGGTIGGVRGT